MKTKIKSEDFFKLSPGTEKEFKEYLIKCSADMYRKDAKFNRGLAKTLNITLSSFNKIFQRYRSNPVLKAKKWAKYSVDRLKDILYKKPQ
jgi:hypothetical protein